MAFCRIREFAPFLFCVIAIICLVPSDSFARTFRYVDDEGGAHLTNRKDSVPPEYQKKVEELEERENADGYIPSLEEAVVNEDRRDSDATWFKFDELSWHKRMLLKFRAGNREMKSILTGMRATIAASLGFLVIGVLVVNFLVKKRSHRCLLISMIVSSVGLLLGSIYVRDVMARGGNILDELRKVKSLVTGSSDTGSGQLKEKDLSGR